MIIRLMITIYNNENNNNKYTLKNIVKAVLLIISYNRNKTR